jgi:hypothetical protein
LHYSHVSARTTHQEAAVPVVREQCEDVRFLVDAGLDATIRLLARARRESLVGTAVAAVIRAFGITMRIAAAQSAAASMARPGTRVLGTLGPACTAAAGASVASDIVRNPAMYRYQ